MDLIADFERRFQCKFDDVRQMNKRIGKEVGTTPNEHMEFASKYGSLKYSI